MFLSHRNYSTFYKGDHLTNLHDRIIFFKWVKLKVCLWSCEATMMEFFLQKYLATFQCFIYSQKTSIIDLWQVPKYSFPTIILSLYKWTWSQEIMLLSSERFWQNYWQTVNYHFSNWKLIFPTCIYISNCHKMLRLVLIFNIETDFNFLLHVTFSIFQENPQKRRVRCLLPMKIFHHHTWIIYPNPIITLKWSVDAPGKICRSKRTLTS